MIKAFRYYLLRDAVKKMHEAEEAYGCGFYGDEEWNKWCERTLELCGDKEPSINITNLIDGFWAIRERDHYKEQYETLVATGKSLRDMTYPLYEEIREANKRADAYAKAYDRLLFDQRELTDDERADIDEQEQTDSRD